MMALYRLLRLKATAKLTKIRRSVGSSLGVAAVLVYGTKKAEQEIFQIQRKAYSRGFAAGRHAAFAECDQSTWTKVQTLFEGEN